MCSWVPTLRSCILHKIIHRGLSFELISQKLFEVCIWNFRILQKVYLCLYISNFRPLSIFCVRYSVSKLGSRCAKHLSKEYFAIFTTLYIKSYFRDDNETFRDYRRTWCLCITQMSNLYVLLYVSYTISKLEIRSTKPQFWAFFTILKCCVFILRHKYTSINQKKIGKKKASSHGRR